MFKKSIILCFLTLSMLVACRAPVYNQTQNNVAEVKLKATAARHAFDSELRRKEPSLLVKDGLYVDTTPISLAREPSWLHNHIVIRGDRLPFSYFSRVVASAAGPNVLTKFQVGLDPAVTVSMNYSGTVKDALELLATKVGYVYAIRSGQQIYWQSIITRTYDVAFMPGGTDYLMGKSSSSTGSTNANSTNSGGNQGGGSGVVSNYVSSDYSDSEYSNLKGTLSIWKDLDSTIRQLLSPDGKVMVSESTTSVTVHDRPTNVELVGQYIANLNRNISKQVLVKVQVLEVNLQNDHDFGIDWNIVAHGFANSNFVVRGNYGVPVAIEALAGAQPGGVTQKIPQFGSQANGSGKIPFYTILLNALNQQGKTSVVSEPRVVCLNNQVSVVRIVRSEGYAASIQNTTLTGSTGTTVATGTVTSQITPGTVTTGLTLYILPKIMKERIYLQVNADLSTNNGFKQFGSDPTPGSASLTAIQLPDITEKHFNQRALLKSGDTLILSGFRQVGNRANATQFLESQALGGQGSLQSSKETVILITPIVLDGFA